MDKVFVVFALLLQIYSQGTLANEDLGLTPAEDINFDTSAELADIYPVYNDSAVETIDKDSTSSSEEEVKLESTTIFPDLKETNDQNESADHLNTEDYAEELYETKVALTPEEQIKKIQEASDRMSKVLQSEFESLASMILNSDKRSKRDTSSIAGNKYVTRLLKHIRANNQHQNDIIDKMMTAQEVCEKFGIDYTPEFETNQVENDSDLDTQASELIEQVDNELPAVDEAESETTTEHITTEQPIEEQATEEIAKPQQQYYETAPVYQAPAGAELYQSPEGIYYYYQVDTPIEASADTVEPSQILETTSQQPQAELHSAQEDIPEVDSMALVPQQTSERQNPFFPAQDTVYTQSFPEQVAMPVAPQEQVFYVMDPVGIQQPGVITEEVEERMESHTVEGKGEESRASHICRSSVHRIARTSSAPYDPYRINSLPQQMMYYFSLA